MKTLEIYCYKKYSEFLKALNSLQGAEQLIQAGAKHRGQYVLICTNANNAGLQTEATDSVIIREPKEQLLAAYFKQCPERLRKNVLCVESERLSSLFTATQTILQGSDYQCIEINRAEGSSSVAVALFINGNNKQLPPLVDCQVTEIPDPNSILKKLF